MMHRQITLLVGVVSLVIVIGLVVSILGHLSSPTGFVTTDLEMTVCKNYDLDKMTSVSDLGACDLFKDELVAEMGTTGLLSLNIDPLLLFALAQQESSCGVQVRGSAGPLTVDGCNPDDDGNIALHCPTRQIRINEGLKIFKKNYESLQAKGVKGQDLLVLTLFAYNRGLVTANKAWDAMQQGKPREQSMGAACAVIYNKNCKGTEILCRYTLSNEDKCLDPGLGAGYPTQILNKYKSYCQAMGGKAEKGTFDATKVVFERYGTYYAKPSFSVTKEYDSEVYVILKNFAQDVVASCSGSLQCVNGKMTDFNRTHTDIAIAQTCKEGKEKIFEDFVINVQKCILSNHSNPCVCDLTKTYQNVDERLDIEITARGNNPYTYLFKLKDSTTSYTLTSKFPLDIPDIIFEYDSSFEMKTKELVGKDNLYLFINPYASDPTYVLGSIENNKLVGMDGLPFVDPITSSDTCSYDDAYYTFCAVTGQNFTTWDGKVKSTPLEISFSLYLKDELPPSPLKGLTGKNIMNYLLVEWEIPQDNIGYYTLYYDTVELLTSLNVQKTKVQIKALTVQSYQQPVCSGSTCVFSVIDMDNNPQTVTLSYHDYLVVSAIPYKDRAVTFIPVSFDVDYYVAVGATDLAGNQENTLNHLNSGENSLNIPKP